MGIEGPELFLAHLASASDYVALMNLNAAWSAQRSGQLDLARSRIHALDSAQLSLPQFEGTKRFTASAERLRTELST